MTKPEPKAWTGGSTPDPRFVDVSPECQAYMIDLYKEELSIWEEFWGDVADADCKSIFRNRAKLDAWATFYQQ